jgi:hypothetical protein
MTDKHPPLPSRALTCMLIAAVVANAPRAGHAAPAEVEPVRNPAAEAVDLFEEATALEREGDKKAAADRYRAAAEANGALHEAEDPASAAYAMFVGRTIKSYDAAFDLSDGPELKRSANDWCTKLLAAKADDPTSAKIREKCTQWGWQPPRPAEPPEPVKPPGPPDTTIDDDRVGDQVATPPSPSKPWRKLAIAGGSTLAGGAIFLALALAGAVRQRSIMREDDDCTLPYDDRCDKLINTGKALRPLSEASAIAGTLLTGTGAVLLTMAMRKRPAKVALAPTLHPQFVGLALRGRF